MSRSRDRSPNVPHHSLAPNYSYNYYIESYIHFDQSQNAARANEITQVSGTCDTIVGPRSSGESLHFNSTGCLTRLRDSLPLRRAVSDTPVKRELSYLEEGPGESAFLAQSSGQPLAGLRIENRRSRSEFLVPQAIQSRELLFAETGINPDLEHASGDDSSDNNTQDNSAFDDEDSMSLDRGNITVVYAPGKEHDGTYDITYLDEGDVFTIADPAAQLSNRTLIVIFKCHESVQCLSLCHHGSLVLRPDSEILRHHCKVRQDGSEPSEVAPVPLTTVLIELKSPDAKLKQDTWINCQNVWTVHKVRFRREGQVTNIKDLMEMFTEVQDSMYGKWRPRPQSDYTGRGRG